MSPAESGAADSGSAASSPSETGGRVGASAATAGAVPPPFAMRQADEADMPAFVALVESAYRGDGSRAGWTTEADLLGGQRLDHAMALEMLAEPESAILLAEVRGQAARGQAARGAETRGETPPSAAERDRGAERGNAARAEAGHDQPCRDEANPDEADRQDAGRDEADRDPADATGAGASGGELLGCVQIRREGERAYFGTFAIAPGRQGGGLGSALMSAAESEARRRWGATGMRMTVIDRREDLIAYYERRGWTRTGATSPFPYGDERFGQPKVEGLHFVELVKPLSPVPGGHDAAQG